MGQRDEIIKGLRELANFLDANPIVPVIPPYLAVITGNVSKDELATMTAIARISGRWKKVYTDESLVMYRKFSGDVEYAVMTMRDRVCTAEVIGETVIPSYTVPERKRKIIKWDCHPLLEASDSEASS